MGGSETPASDGARFVRFYWSSSDDMRLVTVAAVLGLIAAAVMAVFGLPSVDIHGPLHRVGIMDPLCGGTRAARLTARGDIQGAWTYNPLGVFATWAAALAVLRLAIGAATRRWLNTHVQWTPRRARFVLAVLAIATIVLEIRQQSRADLLVTSY